jgi:hypothetical protein
MKILDRIIISGIIVLCMSSVCFATNYSNFMDPREDYLSLLFVIGIIVVWLHWIYRLKKTSKNIAKHIDGDPEDNASVVLKALNDTLNKRI